MAYAHAEEERSVHHAAWLGGRVLQRAAESAGARAFASVSVVRGPAVVLGAHQVAERVVAREALASGREWALARRASAGPAWFVSTSAVWVSVGVPHVSALAADATDRTLLNRSVRPVLGALRALGRPASYFGREWLHAGAGAGRQPVGAVGLEAQGPARLFEACVSLEGPSHVPAPLAAAEELEVDRRRGASSWSLELDQHALVHALRAAYASLGAVAAEEPAEEPAEERDAGASRSLLPPRGYVLAAPRRVAAGWLEVASLAGRDPWLGGDALVPRSVLDAWARGEPTEGPMEGVTAADLEAAVRAAGP